MTTLQAAVQLYLDRQTRSAHPDGIFDTAGRWYPRFGEAKTCCESRREPSRAFPYSLMAHCRSLVHVAQLCEVDITELRRELAKLRREERDRERRQALSVIQVDSAALNCR